MKVVINIVVKCEKRLGQVFKRLPSLPQKTRLSIIKYLPYVVLLIGVVGVFQGITTLIYKIARLIFVAPELLTYDIFVSTIANIVIGGLLIAGFLYLSNKNIIGWRLVFATTLLTGVLNLLSNPFGLLQSFVFLYVLFQIRSDYS